MLTEVIMCGVVVIAAWFALRWRRHIARLINAQHTPGETDDTKGRDVQRESTGHGSFDIRDTFFYRGDSDRCKLIVESQQAEHRRSRCVKLSEYDGTSKCFVCHFCKRFRHRRNDIVETHALHCIEPIVVDAPARDGAKASRGRAKAKERNSASRGWWM